MDKKKKIPRPPPQAVIDVDDDWSPPELPPGERLSNIIQTEECSSPFVKMLTNSDLRPDQNRLMFSGKYARENLVPMLKREESLSEGVHVKVYDLDGKEYPMRFKFWAPKAHVLIGEWCNFAIEHGYKVENGCVIIAWMFRHIQTQKLCFAITSKADLERFTANQEAGNASQPEAIDLVNVTDNRERGNASQAEVVDLEKFTVNREGGNTSHREGDKEEN